MDHDGLINIPWITEWCRNEAIWSLSFCNHIYSNYCGAMTVSWRICSWFAQHTVYGISHKSLHRYHSLRISSFDSVEMFCFMPLFVKHVVPTWILLRFLWQPHHACKASTHLRFAFLSCLKQGACSCYFFHDCGRPFVAIIVAFVFKPFFCLRVSKWGKDVAQICGLSFLSHLGRRSLSS